MNDLRCDMCNKMFDYKEQAICAIRESDNTILFCTCIDCAEDNPSTEKLENIVWANMPVGTMLVK